MKTLSEVKNIMLKYVSLFFVLIIMSCNTNSSVIDTTFPVQEICIEGHAYYKTFGQYNGIALKVNDEGKPIKCKVYNKKK